MAISVIGQSTLFASSGAFSTALALSSSLGAAADQIYLFGGCFNGTTLRGTIGPASNSNLAGTSFTQLLNSSTVTGVLVGLWRRIAGITSPATSAFSLSSAYTTSAMGYGALILRGVPSSSPENVTTVFTSGAGTSIQSPAVTPTVPNCMLVTIALQLNHSSGMTGPAGYSNFNVATTTNNGTMQFSVAVATLLNPTTGSTQPPAFTSTASTNWAAITLCVAPYNPPTSTALMPTVPDAMDFQPIIAQ